MSTFNLILFSVFNSRQYPILSGTIVNSNFQKEKLTDVMSECMKC